MRYIILFVVIIFPGYCFSQARISFSTGLAGFNMQEMKKHQSELQAQYPVDVKIMESFPSFLFYELCMSGEVRDQWRLGGAIGFTSTGGRMHYRDYSGEIECDQFTTAWTGAIQNEVLLNPTGKVAIYLTGKVGAIFGRYDLDLFSEVNSVPYSESLEFKSLNIFAEPGLMMSKSIVRSLSAHLTAGYNVNIYKGNQTLAEDSNLFLQDNSGNVVSLDWSGFRIGVGLSVSFER